MHLSPAQTPFYDSRCIRPLRGSDRTHGDIGISSPSKADNSCRKLPQIRGRTLHTEGSSGRLLSVYGAVNSRQGARHIAPHTAMLVERAERMRCVTSSLHHWLCQCTWQVLSLSDATCQGSELRRLQSCDPLSDHPVIFNTNFSRVSSRAHPLLPIG